PLDGVYVLTVAEEHYEVSISPEMPTLRFEFLARRGALTVDRIRIHEVLYRLEERLGYPARGDLWSPGYFHAELEPHQDVVLTASTETWEVLEALSPRDLIAADHDRRERLLADGCRGISRLSGRKCAVDDFEKELLFAADQFIVSPAGRVHHAARARAA